MRGLIRGAISRFVGGAAALGADFVIGAVGSDVAELLAVVAADWFMDVFHDCDCVPLHKNLVAKELVGGLRVGAGDFQSSYLLVGGASVRSLEPVGCGDGAFLELTVGLELEDVVWIFGVELSCAGDKFH